jgi:hypothetical protein
LATALDGGVGLHADLPLPVRHPSDPLADAAAGDPRLDRA